MKKYFSILFIIILCGALGAQLLAAQTLESITQPQKGRSMRATSGNPHNNSDSMKFEIGETKTIGLLEGPGKITHIWLTPSSMDIRYPRALVLRIYWDGSDIPSVEAPCGRLFCGRKRDEGCGQLPASEGKLLRKGLQLLLADAFPETSQDHHLQRVG